MNIKFKFLLVLLFTICQILKLDAKSREIRWFDYKTALRRKINIDTYELKAEYQAGKWITVGKVNVDPLALKDLPLGFVNSYFHTANDSLIYFTIFGTGQVYEFEPKPLHSSGLIRPITGGIILAPFRLVEKVSCTLQVATDFGIIQM